MLIQGGGANAAKDKVIQANGKGTTTIKDYTVVGVGKVYRSCGNCSRNGGPRNVISLYPPSPFLLAISYFPRLFVGERLMGDRWLLRD